MTPTDPELRALIEAVSHMEPMTPALQMAQAISWCIGELLMAHPEMDREEACEACSKTAKEMARARCPETTS